MEEILNTNKNINKKLVIHLVSDDKIKYYFESDFNSAIKKRSNKFIKNMSNYNVDNIYMAEKTNSSKSLVSNNEVYKINKDIDYYSSNISDYQNSGNFSSGYSMNEINDIFNMEDKIIIDKNAKNSKKSNTINNSNNLNKRIGNQQKSIKNSNKMNEMMEGNDDKFKIISDTEFYKYINHKFSYSSFKLTLKCGIIDYDEKIYLSSSSDDEYDETRYSL